jgi:predicted dehydrogenase
MKNPVRIGVVGLGNMGQVHARHLLEGKVPHGRLTAVVDSDPARLAAMPKVAGFADLAALIKSGLADAVIVATPHFNHAAAGIAALKAGLHVLMEKPLTVGKADAEKLLAAHRSRKQVFGIVYNQRTDPAYQKLRALVRDGELGAVRRVHWTVTDWFRPNAYFAGGGWRATWAGEGGGVLINQSVHNLDLLQWIFGQPVRVRGFCQFGRYHPIEVEDDVTVYLEFANGSHATFITSTGEAPGSNRLEVAAENGRVVLEPASFRYTRNAEPMAQFCKTSPERFAKPATTEVPVAFEGLGGQHAEIVRNFTEAILEGKPLIAPAAEGIRAVELVNAILLSAWTGKTVELPLKGATFRRALQQQIAAAAQKRRKKK